VKAALISLAAFRVCNLLYFAHMGKTELPFPLAQLFLLDSKQEIFHSPNRCAFSLKERDDGEQNVQ
jgi:hypothetical protein